MIPKAVQDAMNEQIKNEIYSGYIYLSASAHFANNNLPGFAHWMRHQAEEELEHAMKFFDFIQDRGGTVTLQAIDQPPTMWKSPLEIFETALKHEQKVTGMINGLVDLAMKEKDHATFEMLQWFVKEQVEEEEHASDILNQIRIIGDVTGHLFCLDHQLAKRE